MQISDFIGHYNSAATQANPITANKGVEKLTSSIEGLEKGNIFEGTVSSVKGGKVTLALSNGQTISARLEGKISLQQGQSMFFQIKSNNGSQVEIRPYNVEGSGNPTLLQALKAAGLPIDPKFIAMVNKMMEEQMPIDKASVSTMARLVQDNMDIDVETLVQMEKLNLPVNKEMAAQFENYLVDKQSIGEAMEEFIGEIPNAMADEALELSELKGMGQELIGIITENLEELPEGAVAISVESEILDEQYVNTLDENIIEANITGENIVEENIVEENIIAENLTETNSGDVNTLDANNIVQTNEMTEKVQLANTLGSIMSEKQMSELTDAIKSFLPEVRIENNTSVVSVMNEIAKQLTSNPELTKENIIKLFSSDGFKAMVKDSLEQQWMIKPEDVANEKKMDKIYDQVKNQLDRMEHAIKESGASGSNISTVADNIKANVEFMNQINEAYTYIQIPLKMSGQNANGELYVYTNKKNIKDKDEELSAFLHLDMENLGSTDVSVKMQNKDVTTNFYLDSDEAYNLVMKFLPMLDEKLLAKGYNVKSKVINEAKHVNFVNDFLKKDQPSMGKLHRYSFDMRA